MSDLLEAKDHSRLIEASGSSEAWFVPLRSARGAALPGKERVLARLGGRVRIETILNILFRHAHA